MKKNKSEGGLSDKTYIAKASDLTPGKPPAKAKITKLEITITDAAGKEIGQLLRDARKSKGITVPEMAAKLGKSPSTITDVEMGRFDTKIGTIAAHALALDCKVTVEISGQVLI